MQITYAALTDKGLKRKNNEDAYSIEKGPRQSNVNDRYDELLCVIADGMGGHSCGEVASRMACDEFSGFLDRQLLRQRPEVIEKRFQQKIFDIDNRIRNHGFTNTPCMDMGTTLSAILFLREKAVIAHVGDSRIYRLRNRNLKQLTTDHNLVQDLVREGLITPEAALTHPFRNKLTQAIGTNEPVEQVDTQRIQLAHGDRFILSTDGLHGEVGHAEIEQVLLASDSPEGAAEQLISLALQGGGSDNITVLVIFLS
ncbi:PP2C family protein-serine/threonine phosphatase [Desulfopila inferna]|uniref:PP2C family protein-serine/threonine phosphatase n=1 Tax=Desulfopila inferna TaxID=468528 RepID=UPI00196578E6|nr:PP2C family serine/threonine-protein phosphatase [Desulfopila inferna]MBM9603808.1 serine/threonine-protein phosphatase [Desulfopila inferna]